MSAISLKTRAISALLMTVESLREMARGRGMRAILGARKSGPTPGKGLGRGSNAGLALRDAQGAQQRGAEAARAGGTDRLRRMRPLACLVEHLILLQIGEQAEIGCSSAHGRPPGLAQDRENGLELYCLDVM